MISEWTIRKDLLFYETDNRAARNVRRAPVLRCPSRTSGRDGFTAWPYARFVSLAEGSRG